MPLLSRTGLRSTRHRLLVGTIYTLLLAGTITMVYPFLLMLAGSTKSTADRSELSILPAFLTSDAMLYAKHVEGLFNESLETMRNTYDAESATFAKLQPPDDDSPKLVPAWREFLRESNLPHYAFTLGYVSTPTSVGAQPYVLRDLKRELQRKYADISELNRALKTEFKGWRELYLVPEDYTIRRNAPGKDAIDQQVRAFKSTRPEQDRYYFSVENFYRSGYLKTQYSRDITAYNKAHGTDYARYDQVHLTPELPNGTERERQDWETFVRTILNFLWLRFDASANAPYQAYLLAKYGNIETLNERYASNHRAFDEVIVSGQPVSPGIAQSDLDAFLQGWKDPATQTVHLLPIEAVRIDCIDFQFQAALQSRYGSVASLNASLGTDYADFREIALPQQATHYEAFEARRAWLRWEFATRNFRAVLDYLLLHGRGVYNTVIYCVLAIVGSLIVNPLAAYALSRFRPPSTFKVLLFLMLTMAFPPMVTQIPAFLMLRDFNLLNTFWALILPGLANGYSIFLLKGFFDSLPQELYDSASLDGAGEVRIFWQVTMALSTPILAVIALNAFVGAYSNFMFALLICQDQKMWTLMVWLYQLQIQSGPGVIYASLILAAIPTFVVFILAQNVIMRGIVVPVEK